MPASAAEKAAPLVSVDTLLSNALPGEIDGLDDETLSTITAFVSEAAARRKPGRPAILIRAFSPDPGERHTRLAIANDDMPFLVDSVAGAISANGLAVERLLHPIVDVVRDAQGNLLSAKPVQAGDPVKGLRESWIFIEMQRVDARGRVALAQELGEVLADVRAAVADWQEMRQQLLADADAIADPQSTQFLRWLTNDNFTLLGHRIEGAAAAGLGLLSREAESPLFSAGAMEAIAKELGAGGASLLIAKADRVSSVHRRVALDYVGIALLGTKSGAPVISSYIGLFTSQALSAPVDTVPLVGERVTRLTSALGFAPRSHAGKALAHVIGNLPHDLLFELDSAQLKHIALTAMSLIDRPRPKLALLPDRLGRFSTALVWLPRDEFSAGRRAEIARMLADACRGSIASWSAELREEGLVSLRFTITHNPADRPDPAVLDRRLQEMVRGWAPAIEAALASHVSPPRAARLALTHGGAFSQSYRSQFGPEEAAADIIRLAALSTPKDREVRLYRLPGDPPQRLRLKIYRLGDIIPLSDAVPVLENFGFRVIEEFPFDLAGGRLGWIHDFVVESRGAPTSPAAADAAPLEASLKAALTGASENDAFNALIFTAGLSIRGVTLVRAWFRYLRQTGLSYGLQTVAEALARFPALTGKLIALFEALHDPALAESRDEAVAVLNAAITGELAAVTAIDDDQIIRRLLSLIRATLRTNAFIPGEPEALAFKFDSKAVPGLPAPVPWREIFVYSPRVEGIHLRGGPIARGGIRWSDRRDDFRTEVLGLMKAQMVKNAVIVPTGAKGGFYPKQLPNPSDREAWLTEGTEAYRIFIRALLSVTDNMVAGKIVHPEHVAPRDGDDAYFVVAADKGTATFSDVANKIALDRDFWLGDAFASGGSNGYDHKAMGITAKGAWLSVQRHFAEMGVDVQSDPVRVAGVGDMSGDVFGNGMLLSKSLKLVAAFDHRHIFIDPDPDPATSWAERDRLFRLPRSSWADYDATLISRGGGIFPRTLKEISLSPEIRSLLELEAESIDPSGLIAAILKAPVDLLWFGGIGTYIKGAAQSNTEAGDRANDAHRVNGRDVRARVIGEGANLGVTQAGRIEFAARGGRINTDFIDNSAGVDCSDNEVNIKIALNREMAEGRLALADRNTLLVEMTDAVAGLVLEDNRLQTLSLSLAERGGAGALPSYTRVIQTLEASGRLNRQVEGLPDDDQLAQRLREGLGLYRPELAVLLSCAKMALQDAIEHSSIFADPLLEPTLFAAFPAAMQERFPAAIRDHRLRNEIIAMKLANRLVNRGGIAMPFALAEEEGTSLGHVANAYATVEALFDLGTLWPAIETTPVAATSQLALLDSSADAVRLHVADLIRVSDPSAAPAALHQRLAPGIGKLGSDLDGLLRPEPRSQLDALRERLSGLGAPAELVTRIVRLHALDGAIGIANLSAALGRPGDEKTLALGYARLGEALGLDWAKGAALGLDPSDPWERLLVAGLIRDFEQLRIDLLRRIACDGSCPETAVERWLGEQSARVEQLQALVRRARTGTTVTPTILAQLASQARIVLGR